MRKSILRDILLEDKNEGKMFTFVVYDAFDEEYYTVSFNDVTSAREARFYEKSNSDDKIVEIYDLRLDLEEQLKKEKCMSELIEKVNAPKNKL